MESEKTQVVRTRIDRSGPYPDKVWRVYRLTTVNSTYELEVQREGEPRRCVVLTCVSPPSRAGESFEDSAPLAGSDSLFAVSPLEWVGRSLSVGTARTSQVQSVDFLTARAEPESLARLQQQWKDRERADLDRDRSRLERDRRELERQRRQVEEAQRAAEKAAPAASPQEPPKQEEPAQKRRPWSPFPEGPVEMAEVAAALLKNVCHQTELFPAVRQDALLDQRLKLAFAECRLMLDAMMRR